MWGGGVGPAKPGALIRHKTPDPCGHRSAAGRVAVAGMDPPLGEAIPPIVRPANVAEMLSGHSRTNHIAPIYPCKTMTYGASDKRGQSRLVRTFGHVRTYPDKSALSGKVQTRFSHWEHAVMHVWNGSTACLSIRSPDTADTSGRL